MKVKQMVIYPALPFNSRSMHKLESFFAVAVAALFALAAFALVVPAVNATTLSTQNQINYQTFMHDINTPCTPTYFTNGSGTFASDWGFCGKATVTLSTNDTRANANYVLRDGFWASCLTHCTSIIYRVDPTALMTNNGHDFMFNCKDFGTAATITCTSADTATYMMLSTSSSSLAVTDTGCGGGSGSGQITSGGLADAAGTFSAGTASGGSVTSTLTHTWTAAETDSSVQVQCVNTEAHSGGNVVLVYEFTFGPVSLVSGNTLEITDSLTAT
jgi:hypothetical protein